MSNQETRTGGCRMSDREAVARAIARARHRHCCEQRPLSDFPISANELEEAGAAIEAYLALSPEGREGWKLVPVAVDDAMIEAYCLAHQELGFHAWANFSFIWPRVLAAAPPPSGGGR